MLSRVAYSEVEKRKKGEVSWKALAIAMPRAKGPNVRSSMV